jgi:integrase
MARTIGRLKALSIARTAAPGRYHDGGGLYLQVTDAGGKSWLFRFMVNGRARAMGLGSADNFSLAEARAKAAECRRLLHDGIDPIEVRRDRQAQERLDGARAITFRQCAEAYVAAHRTGWRSKKHADQWESTLSTYANPVFGSLPVQQVDVGLVIKVLEPIWAKKTETASRVRGRIEAILDWATTRGHRRGDNPARWRGHLENLLPRRSKVQKVEHHPALPYEKIGEFMADLRTRQGVPARALEFLILTTTRTSETIGATWNEIDFDRGLWTIPAERIKAGREHRVPLGPAVLAIVRQMAKARTSDFVFSGLKPGKPLSNMAMLALLRRMNRADLTAHGFRSTFRDWAAEQTNYPREVAEMALAHAIGDKVEAAYRRGDLFEKRRRLMDAWASFCSRKAREGQIVLIRGTDTQRR